MSTYAIIKDRGHQYKVREGEQLRVDRLDLKAGDKVTFDQVLLVGTDGNIKTGQPTVAGAKVTGVLTAEVKGEKLISHRRVRTNSIGTRKGHRTKYSVVEIQKIEA